MRKTSRGAFAAVLTLLALGLAARAADPTETTITADPPPIHCAGCARIAAERVVRMVRTVPGVDAVQASPGARLLTVRASAGQTPSPQALWDAVVQAGYRPRRLEGPGGTITAPGASWYAPPRRSPRAE
jgi:hypothetical protein